VEYNGMSNGISVCLKHQVLNQSTLFVSYQNCLYPILKYPSNAQKDIHYLATPNLLQVWGGSQEEAYSSSSPTWA